MPHSVLIDQNISRKVLPTVSNLFPNSNHVVLCGLENKLDVAIFQYAKEQGFSAILTNDHDFLTISLMFNPPPKILLLRTGNLTNAQVIQLINLKAEVIELFLNDSALDVLEII
jgi:predicted nuclease of predicted toxin-antitoxin system